MSNGNNAGGSINRNTSGSTINSSGCTFTYCGTSASAPTSSDYFTTLKANWSVNSYTVTCIDVIGSSSSGTQLGKNTFSANYGSTVYGSTIGSDTATGKYYTGYYYTGCSSATVETSGATVYRYFRKNVNLELPETGENTRLCFYVLGIGRNYFLFNN